MLFTLHLFSWKKSIDNTDEVEDFMLNGLLQIFFRRGKLQTDKKETQIIMV
jgi:hypothetical protein